MSINLSALMKQRYDTAANWTAQNPTLLAGEIGIESDTKKWKVGTGATAWTSLVYAIGGTYPIVNADIAAGAAIAYSKLATLTSGNIVLGSAANVATSTAVTGDVTISNTGVTAIAAGVIVNADINASAAIEGSKIVAATTSAVGAVQLSDSTSTTSSVLAATPTAVKAAYDLANAALPKSGGTMTGVLNFDLALQTKASTSTYGITQLTNSTTSTDTGTAATAASAKAAADLANTAQATANAALPKSGGTMTGNLEIGTAGSLTFEGATADGFETTLAVVDPTADRTITLPNVTGTVVTTGDTGTVTSTMILDGTIVDGDINASAAIVDTKLATIATAGKVSNSATTATSALGANTIVARDGSNNFTAGTITAALTGAASSNVLKAGDTMTGPLVTPAGTQTAAGIQVGTGTTYKPGIYSPSADQLAISTSGTGRITVDASGNVNIDSNTFYVDAVNNRVGVGTASITNLLHLRSDSSSSIDHLYLQNRNGGANSGARIAFSNGTTDYGDNRYAYIGAINTGASESGNHLVFATNANGGAATEKVRITSDGKVGIGTSGPALALGVKGATGYPATSGTTQTGVLRLSGGTGVYNVLDMGVNEGTDTAWIQATRANGLQNNDKLLLNPNGGNVGIGTTSPSDNLGYGTAVDVRGSGTGNGGVVYLRNSDASVTGFIATYGDGRMEIGTSTNHPLKFMINSSEKCRVDTSGRLLVGTSSTSGNGCLIQARNDSTGLAVEAQRSSDNASAPAMFFTKSRGTQGSPTEVSSGDQLGVIAFSGYDGAAYKDAAYIIAECDGTWTDGGDTTDNPGRLVFSTTADGAASPTPRMTIDSSGYVGINAATPSSFNSYLTSISTSASKAAGVFYGNAASNDGQCALQVVKSSATNTSSQVLVEFFIDAFATGSGRIVSNGASSAAFASFSDENLKENIKDLPGQLDSICKLRPVEFDYKDGSGHQIGFIAQEVQEIYPDVVAAGDDNMLTLTGWSKTEARLVKALQEAIARIETLEANNADMLARLTALEAA